MLPQKSQVSRCAQSLYAAAVGAPGAGAKEITGAGALDAVAVVCEEAGLADP